MSITNQTTYDLLAFDGGAVLFQLQFTTAQPQRREDSLEEAFHAHIHIK